MRTFHHRPVLLASVLLTGAACSAGLGPQAVAEIPPSANEGPAPAVELDPRLGLLAPGDKRTSYMPVAIEEPFASIMARLSAEKPSVMRRQMELLAARYDLANHPLRGVTMSRGKAIQGGVRVKLPKGVTWAVLAALSPAEIREKNLFPAGFYPLPHAKQQEGGMVFPRFAIDEIKKQEGRDLERFDVDFDLPEHFLPEFPPPIYLTTRPDLGDVSRGKLVTNQNFFELFDGILNPKQLDGLRLLTSPFAQQQFNLTDDRRSRRPHMGVACFDCHANGSTNGAFHLVGDMRPQSHRRRIDTPTLRGVNQQRLFGSQRALRTVEDFTEFEQRGAYFDADIVIAHKKGVNFLERGDQVQDMAEFQELLDFPPAPKLRVADSKLDPRLATPEELRGQAVFFGKGQCSSCHPPPIYSDNFMHDLRTERFYMPALINGRLADKDGPIKTFPLRGIKDTPPYLHDGRLLTLEDTVEFFNLVLELQLSEQEKRDLVAFMRTL
jgi:cytochrome c peroxidase